MTHHRIIGATILAFTVLVLLAAVRVVPQIERDLRDSTSEALSQSGATWASVSVTGRTVTLTGGPVSHEARLSAVALARAVSGVSHVRALVLPPDPLPEPEPEPAYGPGLEKPGSSGPDADGEAAGSTPGTAPADVAEEPLPQQAAAPPVSENESSPAVSCGARLTGLADGRTLMFAPGSAAISEQDQAVLTQVAGVLNRCGEWTLTMVGYAGKDEGADSWALADRRAYAVARYFMARGVDESRLAAVTGSGSSDTQDFARVEVFVSGGQ